MNWRQQQHLSRKGFVSHYETRMFWAGRDWSKSNRDIAIATGYSEACVAYHRKKRHEPLPKNAPARLARIVALRRDGLSMEEIAGRFGLSKQRIHQVLDPQKHAARNAVSTCLERGWISRPDRCQKCKEERQLEAHHADYSKPLEVRWLCLSCHAKANKPKHILKALPAGEFKESGTAVKTALLMLEAPQ